MASAYVSSPSLATALGCTVRDVSSGGALIEFAAGGRGQPSLPETFTLTMPIERVSYDCRLAWSNGRTAGVCFAGPARMLVKRQPLRQPPKKAPGALARMLGRKG